MRIRPKGRRVVSFLSLTGCDRMRYNRPHQSKVWNGQWVHDGCRSVLRGQGLRNVLAGSGGPVCGTCESSHRRIGVGPDITTQVRSEGSMV